MADANVQTLLLDPSAKTIYAGTWREGVFASKDGGRHWVKVGGEPPHPDIVSLALDASGPGRLLAGTGGGSVWRLDTTAAAPAPRPTQAPAKKTAPAPTKKPKGGTR
jgi:hypothetical protein